MEKNTQGTGKIISGQVLGLTTGLMVTVMKDNLKTTK
jgi:hypothetical protein